EEARAEPAAAEAPPVTRAPRAGPLPLSFAQRRLWFIEQLEPGAGRYNLVHPLRLRGRLEPAALRRALGEVARRHEVLRTRFLEVGGEPVQVVEPPSPLPLPVADLAGLPEAVRESAAIRLAVGEMLRPFDLSRGPLLRAALLRLAPDHWVLLLNVHHVVYDGWSSGVLHRELDALYRAFTSGAESPLPELAVQYADFAVWQRERLSGPELERQLAYWKAALAGAPRTLELPLDRPRPPTPGARGVNRSLVLPREATGALRLLARREGATLFMTLLAAWQLLLARYSGEEDVVVGSPVAGRTRSEIEPLIGFFVNTLAFRTDLSGDPAWRELLGRVRETTLDGYAHQEVPFERLVEELRVERSLSHTPIFQAMLAVHRHEPERLHLGGLQAETLELGVEPAIVDLLLNVYEGEESLLCVLTFRAGLWEASTAERMLGHLRLLLEEVASAPGRRLSEAALLAPEERERVLHGWNATAAEHPRVGVHRLFEARVRRSPGAVALACGGERLTYAELDARANRLARHLARRGVGPDVRVGLCLERSAELMVAVLGVLKAGGAYVPLDPAYPAERLALMVEDARAAVVLTTARLAASLPPGAAEVVLLDADRERIAGESAEAPDVEVDPDNLAYVIYTSGSTGRPKGVAMPHGPLANLLAWQAGQDGGAAPPATLQFASISFDVSFHEAFSCWAAGGRLVVAPEEARRDPAELLDLLEREGVERLFLPCVALQHLAEEGVERAAAPSRLREVRTAGEQLRVTPAIRAWLGALGAPLHNDYGPSETHVVTSHALGGDPETWPVLPSIGGPIANTSCLVLDGGLRPVPVGVPGELYLAGECLARGYLDRPGPTAERFLPSPHSLRPGARAYRSGDRVRWRADGTLEFLGRADQQVKVRGYRVEPGEVEAVLEGCPGVREAVVVARGEGAARRLVAYVVPAEGARVAAEELRARARAALPEYMVPGAVVVLDALPLTPSGKTDRRALPDPDPAGDAGAHAAPRTPTEEALAAIWAELLGLRRVSIHDGFFDLGGHSLLAMRLVSRARAALGVEIPVRTVFEAQSVAELAARVDAERRVAEDPGPVRVERGGALPLSFGQQRLWFIDRLDPGSAVYNMVLPLRLRGALEPRVLERAVAGVVRRHEALRTTFDEAGGEPVQVVHPAGPLPLPVADLAGLPAAAREAEALRVAAEEERRPFDLCRGPLFHARLLRLAPDDHLLVLAMHHIVSDGWSMGVLFRDLAALHDAIARGEPSPLPELPVQYADFAVWQRGRLGGEALERELAWWRERLAGAPAVLEIPTDHPRRAAPGSRGASVFRPLPAEHAERLRALARSEGATPFMVLLAALDVLLARWSGEDEVVVGTPVANRGRPETEGLIGFFVNTLALRTDVSGNPAFRELLGRVRETTLGAYQHQDFPFEKLVEELGVERSLAHTPVFQVVLSMDDPAAAPRPLRGIDVEPCFVTGSERVKFDLEVDVASRDGGLGVRFSWREELWDASTVEAAADAYVLLLAAFAADPGRRLLDLPLASEAERARVLEGWSAGPAAPPPSRPVHAMVAEQAARTPDTAAITSGERSLTYAGLEERAGRLAARLRALGVGPEVRVGVCLERSPESVVAVLGVMKAGGAYVPLDPAYPDARLAFMVADSGVRVLVTREELRERLPAEGIRVVPMGEEAHFPAPCESPPVSLDHLAYVIYTSGSTGAPKGVLVEHRSLAATVQAARAAFGFGPGEVFPVLASPAFDIWAFEALVPLTAGGTARILPRESVRDLASLADEIRGADLLHAVPALMREVARAAREVEGGFPRVRQLFVGGDAVPPDLLREIRDAFPGARLHVLYGPTEGTIVCASLPVGPRDTVTRQMIGAPLPGAVLHVLDPAGGVLPAGLPGELCIGGVGVARGYLGRPELTAERFVPDPSGGPGARMYRSGDRARWLADGTLEFLGRIDQQVKVRGFRVEPGEIEAALAAHAAVREAVVVVREDAPGDRRLVGYVVPVAGDGVETPLPGALRDHLGAALPDHMVPGAFVVLDAIPRMPSGKLDRRALPAPERVPDEERYVAPRTPLEELVASVWAEVLGLERVGVREHFFELGGHSLLATQVSSRLKSMKLEVPVRLLFQTPTVEALAREVVAREARAGQSEKVAATVLKLRGLAPEARQRLLREKQGAGGTIPG
ncbi:MAG TPA: amino acid adenylation domain-containing protein, partial [Longimicrobiaceae bacterium]